MPSALEQHLIDDMIASLMSGAPPPDLQGIVLEVTGDSNRLASRFPVSEASIACVSVALLAAAALQQARGGQVGEISLDRAHVAAAVRSERFFRERGRSSASAFAPLSRFWRAADGWVRTHANYPWHRDALLRVLASDDDVDDVAKAIAGWRAEDLEDQTFAAGGIAAVVRPLETWNAHPQGQALATEPLIQHDILGDATPRMRPALDLPARGVRVLDLTRVIAGPVCTRFLGALGADVLRLDPEHHPDMATGAVADMLLAKRSAYADLRTADGRETLHQLVADADVLVCGYRPGALERFGLDPDTLADRVPGLVIVYISAWGHSGPWRQRRGFDSVVQAPTGIAALEAGDGDEPGALPCQLLDHGTGYLAAAAVLDGCRRQGAEGGTHVRRLSLARTAMWLTSMPTTPRAHDPSSRPDDAEHWLVDVPSPAGPVTAVAPPGKLAGRELRWPFDLTGYGTDAPRWP